MVLFYMPIRREKQGRPEAEELNKIGQDFPAQIPAYGNPW
jgi:hypothetical protein